MCITLGIDKRTSVIAFSIKYVVRKFSKELQYFVSDIKILKWQIKLYFGCWKSSIR